MAEAQVPLYGTITGGNAISVKVPGNFGGNYYTGHSFIFLAVGSVTSGPVTISVNGAAAVGLKKNVNQDLVVGDIINGQAVPVIYDGTNYQSYSSEQAFSSSTSQWANTAGGIYYNSGYVGIGTNNPLSLTHIYSNTAGLGKGLLLSGNNAALNLGDVFGGNPLSSSTWSLDNLVGTLRIYSQPNLTTGGTVWMSINTQGGVTFPSLATGATQSLGINSVGQLVTLSGGSLLGNGTANGIAFWSNNSTLTADGANFSYFKIGSFIGNTLGAIRFMASTGTGNNLFIGNGAGNTTITGDTNLFIGTNAGSVNSSGIGNTFIGDYAGANNSVGSYSMFIGPRAGYNFNNTANVPGYNMFIGAHAGEYTSNQNRNVYIGPFAGQYNNSNWNTFVGLSAGQNVFSGTSNSYFGLSAGQNNATGGSNSYFGTDVGINSSGSNNVYVGANAGANSTGSGNVFLGTTSVNTSVTANNSIAIGLNTSLANGLTNAIVIGANANVTTSNTLILGGTGGNAVSVGIGNTNPAAILDVTGNARFVGPVSISGLATGGATQALGVNSVGQLVTITGGTSSSITSLNSLTTSSQTFSTSSTGSSINISSSGSVHNFNIPLVTVVGGNNVTVYH